MHENVASWNNLALVGGQSFGSPTLKIQFTWKYFLIICHWVVLFTLFFALQIICDHWFNCHFLNAPIVPGPQPGSSSHLSHVKLIRNTSCPLSKLLSISNTNKFSSVQTMTILVHLMSNNIGKNLKKTRLLILSTYLIIKFSFSFSCAPQRKVILKFSRFFQTITTSLVWLIDIVKPITVSSHVNNESWILNLPFSLFCFSTS